MKTLTGVIARVMYGVPMILFGIHHLMKGGILAGVVPSYVPGGVFWVYFTQTAWGWSGTPSKPSRGI